MILNFKLKRAEVKINDIILDFNRELIKSAIIHLRFHLKFIQK